MAQGVAQEKCGGGVRDEQAVGRDRLADSRCDPGILSHQDLSAQRGGLHRTGDAFVRILWPQCEADRHRRDREPQAALLLHLDAGSAAHRSRSRAGGVELRRRRRLGGCRKGEGAERAARLAVARRMAASARIGGLGGVLGAAVSCQSKREERAMRTTSRRVCVWILMTSLFSMPPVFAGGGGFGTIVFDPSNFGKNYITAMQSVEQTLKQAQMIANQLQQINMQIRNIANIPRGIWNNIMSQLSALTAVVQQGQALAYTLSNLDTVFRLRYPGYVPPTHYTQQYRQWSEGTLDGIRGALRAANLQSNQITTETQE